MTALVLRILRQLRRDPRSVALFLAAPAGLLLLLAWILNAPAPVYHVGLTAPTAVEEQLAMRLQAGGLTVTMFPDGAALRQAVLDNKVDAGVDATSGSPTLVIDGSRPFARGAQGAIATALAPPGGEPRLDVLRGGSALDRFAPAAVAFFVFFVVFLLGAVAFLRERTQGTFERLLASPLGRWRLVSGYILGFGVLAGLMVLELLALMAWGLKTPVLGNPLLLIFIGLLDAAQAITLAIALSAIARTELQIVQFIPVVVLPQALLSGFLFPVAALPTGLRVIADVLPLTYTVEAMNAVALRGASLSGVGGDIAIELGFILVFMLAAAVSVRRG